MTVVQNGKVKCEKGHEFGQYKLISETIDNQYYCSTCEEYYLD